MDIMGEFFKGARAGQAEKEHAEAMEQSKLKQLILKHELDRLKIDDKILARQLATQNLGFLQGQPAADMPSEDVTSQQPNLPSKNLAGMVQGLIQQRQGMEAAPDAVPTAAPDPSQMFTPAPAAQSPTPGTNPVTRQVPRSMTIPGVEGLNVPGVSVRPQSREDLLRAQFASKMNEPYTLAPDATRFVGGTEMARGASRNVVLPQGSILANEGTGKTVATGAPRAKRGRSVAGMLNGARDFAIFDPDTEKYTKNGVDVTAVFKPAPTASEAGDADRDAQRQWNQDFRQYSNEIAQDQRALATALKAWADKYPGGISMDGSAVPAQPEYTAPSFDEWRAARGASAGPAAPAGPKTTAPLNGIGVGAQVTLKDGRKIRVKAIGPNGQITDYDVLSGGK